jgi:GNAT superfamily N-acetyltransferase
VRRELGDGYELDDDKERVDRAAVHRVISKGAYWAKGRPRATQDRLIDEATRVVGLYKDGEQIGFCRAFSDRVAVAYLADVYVLPTHRGRGLGEALVREMVDGGELAHVKWLLHTEDMHPLYRKVGFEDPNYKVLERRSTRKASDSG